MALAWQDIRYRVNVGKPNEREILHGVSGYVRRGRVVGLLGPSGAGKTTLFNILAGRAVSRGNAVLSGQLAASGQVFELGEIKPTYDAAYVLQDDILLATQTPREALVFSAKLRLPEDMAMEEKMDRVETTLQSLGLMKCADTLIGDGHRIKGISGGQKKRVSVGVEMITHPAVMFLDEPTSGLDSYNALAIVENLKELTVNGRHTVIATLHQPSPDIWALLDDVMLLTEGHCVYIGETRNVVDYFSSIGHECPHFTNPADYFLRLIMTDQTPEGQEKALTLQSEWRRHSPPVKIDGHDTGEREPHKMAPLGLQFRLLMARSLKTLARDPVATKVRFGQVAGDAVMLGTLYFNVPHSQQGLHDRAGFLFFMVMVGSMLSTLATVMTFPAQRLLFELERSNGLYSTSIYYLTKTVVQIPENIFFGILTAVITKYMVNLDINLGLFMLITCLVCLTGAAAGHLLGTVASSAKVAIQLVPVSIMPFGLFAGFLVSIDQIPVWIRWFRYLDAFTYLFFSYLIGEMRDVDYFCSDSELKSYRGICPITDGSKYLDTQDIDHSDSDLAFDLWMVVAVMCFYRFVTYALLVRKNGW